VVILITLVLIGLVGTLVPQQQDAASLSSLPPALFRSLQTLQVFDIFHSSWFYLTILFLTLNLLFCSARHFPVAWRRFREGSLGARKVRDYREDTCHSPLSPADIPERLNTLLRRIHYRPHLSAPEDHKLRATAGLISHLGVYIVHSGVFLLILGALMSSLFGINAYIQVVEGEEVDTAIRQGSHEPWRLPFTLQLDRFIIELYDNGMPKQYRSEITLWKGGRLYKRATVMVNHPAEIDGIRLYQASYGELPTGTSQLAILRDGKQVGLVQVRVGDTFPLPGSTATVQVLRLEGNFMNLGPAVKLAVHRQGQAWVFWVVKEIAAMTNANPDLFRQLPLMNPSRFQPYTFVLQSLAATRYSGIQLRRDPGAPVVGMAAIIIMIGLLITYFIPCRELSLSWEATPTGTQISIIAKSNSYGSKLSRDISRLREGLCTL